MGITDFLKRAYLANIECPIGDQDKSWAPHILWLACISHLTFFGFGPGGDFGQVYISENDIDANPDYEDASIDPKLSYQDELSDLICDLNLFKDESELLASRLKERHLLKAGNKITFYKKGIQSLLFISVRLSI